MSDNEIARMARDIEAYKGAGERYEQEITCKDDAIAEQARFQREWLRPEIVGTKIREIWRSDQDA